MGNILICTDDGYKPIESINELDALLTQQNSYKPIEKIIPVRYDECYELSIAGSIPTRLTRNAKLYVRKRLKSDDIVFNVPKWKTVKTLADEDYIGICVNNDNNNCYRLTELEIWDMGRYFAEGVPLRTDKERAICKDYNVGEIPPFILNLPTKMLKYFTLGFFNGSISKTKFKTKETALLMAQILLKMYHKPFYVTETLRVRPCPVSIEDWMYDNGILWQRIKKIKRFMNEPIQAYKIKIGPDAAFVVNGFYVIL